MYLYSISLYKCLHHSLVTFRCRVHSEVEDFRGLVEERKGFIKSHDCGLCTAKSLSGEQETSLSSCCQRVAHTHQRWSLLWPYGSCVPPHDQSLCSWRCMNSHGHQLCCKSRAPAVFSMALYQMYLRPETALMSQNWHMMISNKTVTSLKDVFQNERPTHIWSRAAPSVTVVHTELIRLHMNTGARELHHMIHRFNGEWWPAGVEISCPAAAVWVSTHEGLVWGT